MREFRVWHPMEVQSESPWVPLAALSAGKHCAFLPSVMFEHTKDIHVENCPKPLGQNNLRSMEPELKS